MAEATVQIEVDGHVEHTAALGNGPVNALDMALRKALEKFFPELQDVRLVDYKVRVLGGDRGTATGCGFWWRAPTRMAHVGVRSASRTTFSRRRTKRSSMRSATS